MVKNFFKREKPESQPKKTVTIAFVHHKGGTGKTTSCINIAGWLTKMKKQVLVIDLDPQGNATSGLGVDRNQTKISIDEVLFGRKNIEEVTIETDSGVYLVPSSLDLLAAETIMAGQANNARLLKESLVNVENCFDYIFIDVPPGSTLLMINGIVASENIIIPLDTGIFAYETLETLKTLVIDLSDELGVETNIMMVFLRDYTNSILENSPTKEIRKLVKKYLADNNIPSVKIFSIPFSNKIYRSQMKGKPISHYAPFSKVGGIYKKIAKEIIRYEY